MLEVNGLTKKYGDFAAVKDVAFSVAKGEIFGFLGPNGAGKTTTINMLTGLAKITSGSVNLSGIDLTRHIKQAQQLMGIVPDESNLYEELDGFENLCFCASLYGLEKRMREERARHLLSQFGLADTGKKLFKAYSKGMKRKLTIAAGIIHEPKVLFLDEPTTGIDVASARQIRSLIKELNKNGTTVFLTTHYIEEAERLCHRVAFIVGGEIVRCGTTDELMQEAQRESIVQFSFDGGASKITQVIKVEFPDYTVEITGDNSIRIHSPASINLMPFMRFFEDNGLTVFEAKIIRPSLEEVFVKVTGIEPEKMKKEKEGRKK
ncbi:ABC-2 type transport system ATP-binding protein [Desulfotomaculum arcticum]|uniref:ABC-2 type transport system ATP-binding protein n=1 Tax=Desulfotruncus arcticus DSM 17038 TaxID=1121424 RepID=A0A1I2X5U1_9FIRM|nr:ABC transporter ATP-binding protein [Desulfotruncus arcticus]SFH08782.1 ABC-2 type transport system ATP-binding protein [Desulfotomaculum arcticum] [Desulfotruncus arcticus DSM 17038]